MSAAPGPRPLPDGEPLLDIHEATVVRGDHAALDRLSLRIDQGEHTAILGRNGSGKSTLVRLIARELHPLARAEAPPPVRLYQPGSWGPKSVHQLIAPHAWRLPFERAWRDPNTTGG